MVGVVGSSPIAPTMKSKKGLPEPVIPPFLLDVAEIPTRRRANPAGRSSARRLWRRALADSNGVDVDLRPLRFQPERLHERHVVPSRRDVVIVHGEADVVDAALLEILVVI